MLMPYHFSPMHDPDVTVDYIRILLVLEPSKSLQWFFRDDTDSTINIVVAVIAACIQYIWWCMIDGIQSW